MTEGADSGGRRRTVPVEPPVHVEVFAGHCSVTWKADELDRFLSAVHAFNPVPARAPVVVDTATTAGRERTELSVLDAGGDTTKYVRVEPSAPWTASWERRTWPVVSLSGTPPPAVVRRLHRGTTACGEWSEVAAETLERLTAPVR